MLILKKSNHIRLSASDRFLRNFAVIMILLFSFIVLLPVWWLLVDSFSSPNFYNSLGIHWFPDRIDLEAYAVVLRQSNVITAYKNTILRTIITVVLSVLVTFCCAYAISKPYLKFRKIVMLYMIIPMYFGGGLIPSYLNMKQLGFMNNFWVYVIPCLVSSYNAIIMRNFISALPHELEESAMIDGASEYRMLASIIFPLSLPIIATIALWVGVGQWNAWFDCMIYGTESRLIVLQMLVRKIVLENQVLEDAADSIAEQTVTSGTVRAATIFVAIGPIILIYPFIQKYFVKGTMVGAVKG